MVDISERLAEIKKLIDRGNYFTINRERQYGKSTTLYALKSYLADEYIVVSMDFQMLSSSDFVDEAGFVTAFSQELLSLPDFELSEKLLQQLEKIADGEPKATRMTVLFRFFSAWCKETQRPIVLMIDEVDSASNN